MFVECGQLGKTLLARAQIEERLMKVARTLPLLVKDGDYHAPLAEEFFVFCLFFFCMDSRVER